MKDAVNTDFYKNYWFLGWWKNGALEMKKASKKEQQGKENNTRRKCTPVLLSLETERSWNRFIQKEFQKKESKNILENGQDKMI